MTDRELIREVSRGNESAFREVFSRYADRIYHVCLGILNNEQDAEDITQEVFVRIYEKSGSYRGKSEVGTWIYRIAVNSSLNALRKRKHSRLITEEIPSNPGTQITDYAGNEAETNPEDFNRILSYAMKKLPVRQRTALTLFCYDELSRKEIALIMNTSLKSVESLLNRARENLKKALKAKNTVNHER